MSGLAGPATAAPAVPDSAVAVPASAVAVPDSVRERHYVGLVTRAISFALDAAVINLVATIVGLGAALILSLLHLPHAVRTILAVLGAVGFVVWVVGYFAVFWSTTGQTPGERIMEIRVLTAAGAVLGLRRALLRCAGVVLAALPLFLGFVPILFDDERRGLQDRLAGTVVVRAPQDSVAAVIRARKRDAYRAARREAP